MPPTVQSKPATAIPQRAAIPVPQKAATPFVATAAPAAPAPVAAPAADPGAEMVTEPEGDAPSARKTRKDFATPVEFYEYKRQNALVNVAKWAEIAKVWEAKKLNPGADNVEKQQKKADKLLNTWIETQRQLGMPEEKIQELLAVFQQKLGVTA